MSEAKAKQTTKTSKPEAAKAASATPNRFEALFTSSKRFVDDFAGAIAARGGFETRAKQLNSVLPLKVVAERADKVRGELSRVVGPQAARAQDLAGQVVQQVSSLR